MAEEISSAYRALGISPSSSRAEVKEAFVRLCQQHHPDKVAAAHRVGAEARFRDIKAAYDNILRSQAGYQVPPPGSSANPKYARAYYRAHNMGMDFGEGGPVRCGGPFGGYATEFDFYRSMFRVTRNNPFVVITVGLLSIPAISILVGIAGGDAGWIRQFRDQGLHMFGQDSLRANGRDAVGINPFSIRKLEDLEDSYIYKNEKYAHLRKPKASGGGGGEASPSGAGAAPAPA